MIELIQKRLEEYQVKNPLEEEQAIKEIIQEIALYALWHAGFFEVAAFQGGTSLRILHKMPRFSEDLDFILINPDQDFEWGEYLKKVLACFEEFGLKTEVIDKSKMERNLRQAVLKDNSIANQLNLSFYSGREDQKQKIKLEIDVNPPKGSQFEYTYLDFPTDYEVCHQDLGSNFALKIHALLCRPYLKGRDWYDFNWYVKQRVKLNLSLLKAALYQYGSWKSKELNIDDQWVKNALLEKISEINWPDAAADVERFLNSVERESLKLWSERFFSEKVEKLI
jgi:predicted nucleotidyltransferase component of viral defense system